MLTEPPILPLCLFSRLFRNGQIQYVCSVLLHELSAAGGGSVWARE